MFPNRAIAARDLLASLAALQALATMAIDLRRTHATHPAWPGHARFHVVWQTATGVLLAVATEYVLLGLPVSEQTGFLLAAILTALPMLGFLMALVSRTMFQATLRDPEGSMPLVLQRMGKRYKIDLNLVAVCLGLGVLVVLCWIHGAR